ncbi:hypothetical protein EUGRSUZ_H04639 [Eucalyptus grandis]|uniref:Uncharacterized protein n=2 Tax=Eucalyptus grandis TaxID=71139 RepID=A0A059B767_EUCGR|nr:hypothetical protein EUGRSUZ_H04639 [Eucalyptus grandis]
MEKKKKNKNFTARKTINETRLNMVKVKFFYLVNRYVGHYLAILFGAEMFYLSLHMGMGVELGGLTRSNL